MRTRQLVSTAALLLIAAPPTAAQRVHNAAADGDLDRLQSVLACDGDLVHATNHMGATPLHLAALEGHTDVVKTLLTQGSSPNASEAHGLTPLHYAVLRGHTDVIELLLAAGADPNYRPAGDGPTPADFAFLVDAFRGTTTLTAMLLEAGSTIDPEAASPVLPSKLFTAQLAGNGPLVRLLHELLPPAAETADAKGGEPVPN